MQPKWHGTHFVWAFGMGKRENEEYGAAGKSMEFKQN